MTREQVEFLRNLSTQTIPGSTFRQAIEHIDAAEALLARYQKLVIQPDDSAHESLWDETRDFLSAHTDDGERDIWRDEQRQ